MLRGKPVRRRFVRKPAFLQPKPRLGAEILHASLSTPSPVWEAAARKTEFTSGLNIVIIHSGFPPPECDDDTVSRTKALMMEGFLWLYNGYNVGRIFVEAFGESEREFYLRSQFVEVSAAADTLTSEHSTVRASYLLVLTRERVLSLNIHPLLPIFTNAAPKCLFSHGEQAVLARALEGHTDEELAAILGLSLSSIKKRWIHIFQRVEVAIPELPLNERRDGQKRGMQKRHSLLRYLRNRPEELRPFTVSKSRNVR